MGNLIFSVQTMLHFSGSDWLVEAKLDKKNVGNSHLEYSDLRQENWWSLEAKCVLHWKIGLSLNTTIVIEFPVEFQDNLHALEKVPTVGWT
jgi:hypothetical protein